MTGAEALKPSVVNITGPLIRILGDRFAWTLKVAVLDTLSMLLVKVRVGDVVTSVWVLVCGLQCGVSSVGSPLWGLQCSVASVGSVVCGLQCVVSSV